MFEAIVSGLLLAFVSGITFLAYRHPSGYQRLILGLSPLLVGLGIGGIVALLFTILIHTGSGVLIAKEFPDKTLGSFSKELEEMHEYTVRGLWGIAIALAAALYFAFLWFLPSLTRGAKSDAA